MKYTLILVTYLVVCFAFISYGWAYKDCEQDPSNPSLKSHACELIEAEGSMVDSASSMIAEACEGKSNRKSCENAQRRMGELQRDILKTHDENDALEETDYIEMIEAPYKGRGKDRDNAEKSCQSKNVDSEDLADFLADMEAEPSGTTCFDCLVFFTSKDEDKAYDDKCNSWKVKVLDENGDKAGIIHISEKQEQLCPTECKGKDKLVREKRARFHANIDTSIAELTFATEELDNESTRIASLRMAAKSANLEPAAIEQNACDEAGTEQPISAGVIAVTFTVVNVSEWLAEICEPPADQTIAGFNASAVCLVPVTALQIAKEVYDVMNLFNDEFQGEQITHIQECSELMNTKINDLNDKVDELGDQLDEINKTVQEIRELIITPQGQRASGDTVWPNKN